jgi:very-short-patch-repair endonuclease
MKYYAKPNSCLNCNAHIDLKVFEYSSNKFGFALCISCQKWIERKFDETTPETIKLYFSLRERGVPAQLEKNDGHKRIDIAVVEAKVNIEVDGAHHNFNSKQALSDLQRTYYAFKKGYFTLRIPNSLVWNNLAETADYITDLLNVSNAKGIDKH